MLLYQRIELIVRGLLANLYEREEALRLALLGALAGRSVFFLGPPGVSKSMLARRLASAFADARFFDYLMGRFSTPDEIFGPVSIAGIRDAEDYRRNVEGFLPSADIVFLDEIWKASSPIQNSLLTVLNERIYRNGRDTLRIPLKCFIAASNEIGLSADTRAFWDRFLLRLKIEPIRSVQNFRDYLLGSADTTAGGSAYTSAQTVREQEWREWIEASRAVALGSQVLSIIVEVRGALAERSTNDDRYYVSDRRWKQVVELMKVSAFFHDRRQVSLAESFILLHCLWNDPEEDLSEIIYSAIGKFAFAGDSDVDVNAHAPSDMVEAQESPNQGYAASLEAIQARVKEAGSEQRTLRVLEPLRYEGEYIRFVPDTAEETPPQSQVQTPTEPSPQTPAPSEGAAFEYRIWAEDLMPAREHPIAQEQEFTVECFVHAGGFYTETIDLRVVWLDRATYRLKTNVGQGRIEAREVKRTELCAVPIAEGDKKALGAECERLVAGLEGAIRRHNSAHSDIAQQITTHLFVPQKDIGIIEEAYALKLSALNALLADALLLRSSITGDLGDNDNAPVENIGKESEGGESAP